LSVTGPMLAVLSVVPVHSDVYAKETLSTFLQPISLLHKPQYVTLECHHQLLDLCKSVSLAVTSEWLSRLRHRQSYKLIPSFGIIIEQEELLLLI